MPGVDILSYAERLQRSGFSDTQAKALAEIRLEMERANNQINTLRDEVNALKGGRPARAEDLHQLELRLIPAETFLGNWPWLLGMAAMVAAIVSLLLSGIARG